MDEGAGSNSLRLQPDPCRPGPSGVSRGKGWRRKRFRPPSPLSDFSLSDSDLTFHKTKLFKENRDTSDYYNVRIQSDHSSVSDCEIPWALGHTNMDWTFPSDDDDKEIYHEYPRTFLQGDDLKSIRTVMYRMRFVTEYPTSVITDSEDCDPFLVEDANAAEDYWQPEWDGHDSWVLQFHDNDDSSDDDDTQEEATEEENGDTDHVATEVELDDGFEAGDEEDGVDPEADIELSDEDCWACSSCGNRNHPMTRRCIHCWGLHLECMPFLEMLRTTSGVSTDSGISMGEENAVVQEEIPKSIAADNDAVPQQLLENELCLICLVKPRNASMIHKKTGHQVCCYGCARKLQRLNQPCPICRKSIELVVKNFM